MNHAFFFGCFLLVFMRLSRVFSSVDLHDIIQTNEVFRTDFVELVSRLDRCVAHSLRPASRDYMHAYAMLLWLSSRINSGIDYRQFNHKKVDGNGPGLLVTLINLLAKRSFIHLFLVVMRHAFEFKCPSLFLLINDACMEYIDKVDRLVDPFMMALVDWIAAKSIGPSGSLISNPSIYHMLESFLSEIACLAEFMKFFPYLGLKLLSPSMVSNLKDFVFDEEKCSLQQHYAILKSSSQSVPLSAIAGLATAYHFNYKDKDTITQSFLKYYSSLRPHFFGKRIVSLFPEAFGRSFTSGNAAICSMLTWVFVVPSLSEAFAKTCCALLRRFAPYDYMISSCCLPGNPSRRNEVRIVSLPVHGSLTNLSISMSCRCIKPDRFAEFRRVVCLLETALKSCKESNESFVLKEAFLSQEILKFQKLLAIGIKQAHLIPAALGLRHFIDQSRSTLRASALRLERLKALTFEIMLF